MVKLRADLQIGSYWATTDSLRCVAVANLKPFQRFHLGVVHFRRYLFFKCLIISCEYSKMETIPSLISVLEMYTDYKINQIYT